MRIFSARRRTRLRRDLRAWAEGEDGGWGGADLCFGFVFGVREQDSSVSRNS